jgi:lipoprotein signal peptidase
MAERSYRWLFWALALAGLALDQGTKYGVMWWLQHHGRPGTADPYVRQLPLLGDEAFLLAARFEQRDGELRPEVNQGALFGLGRWAEDRANGAFAAVSLAAAAAILYWSMRRSTARDWALCAALGLILAGTLGNLYDRLVFEGVRDFLDFRLIRWPVFNLADCCLVAGAFLLLGQAFWGHPQPAEQPASEALPSEAKSA